MKRYPYETHTRNARKKNHLRVILVFYKQYVSADKQDLIQNVHNYRDGKRTHIHGRVYTYVRVHGVTPGRGAVIHTDRLRTTSIYLAHVDTTRCSFVASFVLAGRCMTPGSVGRVPAVGRAAPGRWPAGCSVTIVQTALTVGAFPAQHPSRFELIVRGDFIYEVRRMEYDKSESILICRNRFPSQFSGLL